VIDIEGIFGNLIDSAQHVILSMAPLELERGEMGSSDSVKVTGEVSGNMGITGEMKMSLTVSFSKEAITRIYHKVFPDEPDTATVFQMADLVGEMTNMIGGNFRNMSSELGMKFESSIPTVVVGPQQVYHPAGSITRVIPFSLDGHPMFLEISIRGG
jgi:chemotaxis protein CheX